MDDEFDIEPCRGITNPDIEHYVRKRNKVRNKVMKKIKVKEKQETEMGQFDGSLFDGLDSDEQSKESEQSE